MRQKVQALGLVLVVLLVAPLLVVAGDEPSKDEMEHSSDNSHDHGKDNGKEDAVVYTLASAPGVISTSAVDGREDSGHGWADPYSGDVRAKAVAPGVVSKTVVDAPYGSGYGVHGGYGGYGNDYGNDYGNGHGYGNDYRGTWQNSWAPQGNAWKSQGWGPKGQGVRVTLTQIFCALVDSPCRWAGKMLTLTITSLMALWASST